MNLSAISLGLTRIYGGPFSPSSLFAAGEQGVWYDPNDTATLFQDSAGTTPVTAVEQPVGLMLDKSKGLVLGSELVTNGDFSGGSTGWAIVGANVTIASGKATWNAAAANERITQGTLDALKWYLVAFDVVDYAAGTVYFNSTNGNKTVTGNGRYSYYITGATNIYIRAGAAGFTGSIDNISVRELPGNHAFQATSTSRPVLSARYNLLTKTEQFDDAAWTKTGATVTPNSVTAPDGTLTADALVEDGTTGNHWVFQTVGATASHLSSVYLKAGSRSWAALRVTLTGPVVSYAYFDLTNGVVGSVASGLTASITSVGNGWYRCTIAGTLSGSIPVVISAASADGVISYAGNNSTALYLWGADLRVTNDAAGQPAYQRVNTATDYDTTGFKPYLRFDGTDDWLQTNSINFTATDKMTVFAGVRKLSDAALGIFAELSNATGNGYFSLAAPSGASATYRFASMGTVFANSVSPSSFAAPITNVLAGLGDISGDSAILRVNGAQVASSTADQGTGTFGNYPLYIGRRGGSTLPFNGRLYGLIVRGSQSTAQQITNTENWLNQRTGAY